MLTSCDSSDNDDADDACSTAEGIFTAQVAGDGFSAVCAQAGLPNGVFFIAGIENVGQTGTPDQRQVNITVPNAATGQRPLSILSGTTAVYAEGDINGADAFVATSGTLNLTTLSASGAPGTFSFDGQNNAGDQISVTAGSFDVTF